jgi:hypothetical protein
MMKDLDKSSGMCSDCSRITPKSLDLEVSPTCLREKEREPLESGARFGGGEKGTSKYKPNQADPIFLSSRGLSAISRRTVRD